MRLHGCTALSLVLFLVALAMGCSRSEPPKKADSPAAQAVSAAAEGKALFEKKCGLCHGLDRATVRTETRQNWERIVEKMQEMNPDWISETNAAKIAEFLASEHGKK